PEDDVFTFDVSVVAPQKVKVSNNLLNLRLDPGPQGLRLAGTNQRFGVIGTLQIDRDSKLYFRDHQFDITDGRIDFSDPEKVAPRLDVRAVTEYRRFSSIGAPTTAAATSSAAGGANLNSSGRWRIVVNVFGPLENLNVRLTSEPPLSQEDIILLLQVGLTRAELEQGLLGSVASTLGIETLSAITGFNDVVSDTVPVIDEFRVSSQYSSRTGRPEPTITLGKRVTDQVRATVTTGLGEEREIRTSVEWQLNRSLSLQGGWDNVNDVSTSVLGNTGAGLRWRIEFK
ncbi:MAG: translocation/assembly module TamB domain-containing protein, partial [Myxococcota bacterium]